MPFYELNEWVFCSTFILTHFRPWAEILCDLELTIRLTPIFPNSVQITQVDTEWRIIWISRLQPSRFVVEMRPRCPPREAFWGRPVGRRPTETTPDSYAFFTLRAGGKTSLSTRQKRQHGAFKPDCLLQQTSAHESGPFTGIFNMWFLLPSGGRLRDRQILNLSCVEAFWQKLSGDYWNAQHTDHVHGAHLSRHNVKPLLRWNLKLSAFWSINCN